MINILDLDDKGTHFSWCILNIHNAFGLITRKLNTPKQAERKAIINQIDWRLSKIYVLPIMNWRPLKFVNYSFPLITTDLYSLTILHGSDELLGLQCLRVRKNQVSNAIPRLVSLVNFAPGADLGTFIFFFVRIWAQLLLICIILGEILCVVHRGQVLSLIAKDPLSAPPDSKKISVLFKSLWCTLNAFFIHFLITRLLPPILAAVNSFFVLSDKIQSVTYSE